MNYDNRKFCIVATSAQNLAHIASGKSHGVKVIKHRLELSQRGLPPSAAALANVCSTTTRRYAYHSSPT